MASSVDDLKIKEKSFYKAKLPFPQRPNGVLSEEKTGLRYKISLNDKEALCDLSPFPGLNTDPIEEVRRTWEELFSIHKNAIKKFLNSDDYTSLTSLKKQTKARASVEFALFQLWYQLSPSSPSLSGRPEIQSNEVMPFSDWLNKDLREIEKPNEKRTLKIKCSKEEVGNLLKDLENKHQNHPDKLEKFKLRIDGNTAWQANDLLSFWDHLKNLGLSHVVDYFEEPLQNFQEYKKLSTTESQEEIPIAHEEFLNDYLGLYQRAPQAFKNLPRRTLVIKPSQWSLVHLFDLKKQFKSTRVVLSSAFELPQGIDALTFLAYDLYPQEVHGLGAKILERGIFREN